ncbi:MAG: DUF4175 family protein, partial [Gemmatimonadales bacterium]
MTPIEQEHAERDEALRQAVTTLRRHWKRRVMLEGAAIVAITVVGAILVGALISALLGPGSTTATVVRVVGYLLIGAAAVRFLFLPAIRQVNSARLALYVEEQAPELRQTLLSAVDALESPAAERSSPALAARVIRQATEALDRLERGALLERPRARRATAGLAGAAAVGALLIAFGPSAVKDVARVLFVPWSEAEAAPVLAVSVSPGNISIPRGASLDIRAELLGFNSAHAELVMRPDSTDADWIRVPMLRDSTETAFTVRVFDLVEPSSYFVESEGVTSPTFKITVTNLPAVQQVGLELQFPNYTGLPAEIIEDGGDVAAVVGTNVIVRAMVTMPVTGGQLRFDDGTTTPLEVMEDGRVTASFRLQRDGYYRVDLVAPDGAMVPGTVNYTVEALEDLPPVVRIDDPGRDTKPNLLEEVTISVRADDDYGVAKLELRYT